MPRPSAAALDYAGTVVRIGLAAVWLVSGGIKLADTGQTYLAVQAYDLLPAGWVSPVAMVLPLLELSLGVLLLAGAVTRWAAVVSAVVLVGFIAAVGQAWARGLSIDCGCFGGGGTVAEGQTRYPQELALDAGFLLLAAWLVIRPRTRWGVSGTNEQEREDDGWSRAGRTQETAAAGPATGHEGHEGPEGFEGARGAGQTGRDG
ncbi:MAG: MauE/DoxX family redox-associated membrane protein [Thermocrispum sp.]